MLDVLKRPLLGDCTNEIPSPLLQQPRKRESVHCMNSPNLQAKRWDVPIHWTHILGDLVRPLARARLPAT